MIVVSACLAGVKCRHDGKSKTDKNILKLVEEGKVVLVCPEQLGGLGTPRSKAEKIGNKIFTIDGRDVTKEFRRGAEEALKTVKLAKCEEAILKSKSPSCGSGRIYNGSFSGKLKEGDGLFAELLKKEGIKVKTEKEILSDDY